MQKKLFERMLKKFTPKELIFMHTISEIYLTSSQLDKVLELKNRKEIKQK